MQRGTLKLISSGVKTACCLSSFVARTPSPPRLREPGRCHKHQQPPGTSGCPLFSLGHWVQAFSGPHKGAPAVGVRTSGSNLI